MLATHGLPPTRVGQQRPDGRVGSARAAAGLIGVGLALLALRMVYADQPTPVPMCALRLSVEVTPDVPNPSNGGFLSSLLGDNVGYQLFLIETVDDTHVNLQLQGPGPPERCQAVVDSMRNDGRVVSIDVT
jgi:hypothetical protein